MKKIYALAFGLLSVTAIKAQFVDDFESYTAGEYLGSASPVWRVWSANGEGTTEDVKITEDDAASGTKSIHFTSTAANGGPQDVVLPFGGAFNSGLFDFTFKIKVMPGKSAYFNFQASETIGDAWAMDCNFNANGSLALSNQGVTYLNSTYTQGEWIEMHMNIDLNTNVWEMFLDGVSHGAFFNPTNSVALLDLFPLNGSDFFVDDVEFTHTVVNLLTKNAAVTNVLGLATVLATQEINPMVEIRNLGSEAITSVDVSYSYNGQTGTETISGLNLSSLQSTTITLDASVTLVPGQNPMEVCVKNVNGGGDDEDVSDDCKSVIVNPAVPAAGKMVIGEEGTGTWCGWCPRGTVSMEHMAEAYPSLFQGIAVHNGDPMTDVTYDGWMGTKISGYPGGFVDRGAVIDPGAFEAAFITNITTAPVALVNVISAEYNPTTQRVETEVEFTFESAVTGNWKYSIALVEDGVSGTSSAYSQSNYYSGGGNGVMGGFENMPNPVPASQMVYDDVARGIAPSAAGTTLSQSIAAGEKFTVNQTFAINTAWDVTKMSVVPFVIRPNNSIENGGSAPVQGSNGLAEINAIGGIKLFPNPTQNWATVQLDILTPNNVEIEVLNLAGQVVLSKNYGVRNGTLNFPINTEVLSNGMYLVKMQVGETIQTERLQVIK